MAELSKLTRRDFIKASAIAATGILVQACAKTAEPTQAPAAATATPAAATATPAAEQPTATPAPAAGSAQEAPGLAEQVSAGTIPPVDERLPQDPMAIQPFEEIGQYSQDVHRVLKGASDLTGYRVIVRDNLVCWNYGTGDITIENNLASKWDLSSDGTEYTFYLRKGLSWSDGQPLTADDLMFYYEDMLLNTEMTPTFPTWLSSGGEPGTFEKVDDYTVKMTFPSPYSILPMYLCFRAGTVDTFCPKHYLEQFHPAYANADELAKAVSDAGFDEWFQLFADRNEYTVNTEVPVAKAWQVTVPFPGQQMVSERNPYYWKADSEGKQLPYFDQLVNDYAADNEAVALKIVSGEVDFQYRSVGYADFSLFKENEANGDYRVLEWIGGSWPCVYVNQSVKDEALRELFQQRDFRHALSYGINRQEVNDLMFYGKAIIGNPVAWEGDPYWLPEFNHTAIDFDTAKANELLDGIGLDQRDSDGYRLRPDGQRLELTMTCYPSEMGVPAIDIFNKVAEYWDTNLGIKSTAEEVERSLWSERALAGDLMMASYDIANLLWVIDPLWFVPVAPSTYWAPLYGLWYSTGGKGGEEPPQEYMQLIDWYEQLTAEPDQQKQIELGQQILRQHDQEVYVIGVVKLPFQPMIKHNTIVNVLEKAPAEYRTYHESITWPSQLWRKS
jgi:peptide/nickel transport system substrate-binding protein